MSTISSTILCIHSVTDNVASFHNGHLEIVGKVNIRKSVKHCGKSILSEIPKSY